MKTIVEVRPDLVVVTFHAEGGARGFSIVPDAPLKTWVAAINRLAESA